MPSLPKGLAHVDAEILSEFGAVVCMWIAGDRDGASHCGYAWAAPPLPCRPSRRPRRSRTAVWPARIARRGQADQVAVAHDRIGGPSSTQQIPLSRTNVLKLPCGDDAERKALV